MIWLTDRSRQLEGQRCPRARFLGYHWQGVGLRSVKLSIPLVVGHYVHQGVVTLLMGHGVEEAVGAALDGYAEELSRRGFDLAPGEDQLFVVAEQKALLEGLVRCYTYRQLPRLLAEFDVLEVEKEEVWRMYHSDELAIDMMARADALLKAKDGTEDLLVLSLKTASLYDSRRDGEASHDVQGLSEVGAIEARLSKMHWFWHTEEGGEVGIDDTGLHGPTSDTLWELVKANSSALKLAGVKMEYLLKGPRKQYPDDSGQWRQFSPLIYAWRRDDVAGAEYAWRYQWRDRDTGQTHRLGKGWKMVNIWEEQGVAEWTARLASGEVQPEAADCLEAQIVTPVPYFRNEQDFEDWRQQTIHSEARWSKVVGDAQTLNLEPDALHVYLNERAPQNRRSCDWPSSCQFLPVCFGQAGSNPLGNGFELRVPHHRAELVRIEEGRNG